MTFTQMREIKTLDDLDRASLPEARLEGNWWRDFGMIGEPISSDALGGLAARILRENITRLEQPKGSMTASHELAIVNDLAVVRELKRRADAARAREIKERRESPFDPRGPVGYGPDGSTSIRPWDADASRADVGPGESVKTFLQQRGKLEASRELAGTSFGGVLRSLIVGPRTEFERKALAEGTDSAGGYTVPLILLLEVIDAMRARTVTIQAGARTIPLDSEKTAIAKLTSDPAAAWRSENAVVAESDPTFDRVLFQARSLAVIVKASRELLEDSVNIDAALRGAFAGAMAVELDRVALVGTGTAPQPRGISTTSGVGSVSMGTNGAALTNYDKILDALQLTADANAQEATAAVMAPRTLTAISKLKDTTNQPLRRPTSLERLPFLQTTSLPVNETQGTANNASRLIVGNFAELLIGVRTAMRVEVLRETFAGNFQYGFLAHLRADVALAHPASFAQVIGIIP